MQVCNTVVGGNYVFLENLLIFNSVIFLAIVDLRKLNLHGRVYVGRL